MHGIDGKVLSWPLKKQFLTVVLQNCEKSGVKYFTEKPMLLNFVGLSTIFCPRLQNFFSYANPWSRGLKPGTIRTTLVALERYTESSFMISVIVLGLLRAHYLQLDPKSFE